MTQKDNVKQLIGKSLNAYNNKVLQQIDRIEKKNKQQNHKISMLTNELDNDYLTKTEEGSVISLEHSKEGMVYIDGLEGNTLVNYCTDGAKELTLNGDIDLEGTFVTTTEGVDNGLVDVYCEGNTLVNVCGNGFKELSAYTQLSGSYLEDNSYVKFQMDSNDKRAFRKIEYTPLKPSTKYTVFVEVKENTISDTGANHILYPISNTSDSAFDSIWGLSATEAKIGIHKKVVTTKSDFDGCTIGVRSYVRYIQGGSGYITYRLWLVEGEHLDKDIPYFEGMKSVGQDDENGHKIEILSRNSLNEIVGNGVIGDLLINQDGSVVNGGSADNYFSSDIFEEIEPNTQYYFWHSKDGVIQNSGQFIYFYDKNRRLINGRQTSCTQFVSYSNAKYFKMMVHRGSFTNIKFFVSKQNVKPTIIDSKTKSNKKEILLNEPLRKANDNVKDRFVKINGKLYIERNCKQLTITGNEPNVVWRSDGILGNVYRFWSNNFPNCITLNADGCVFIGSYEGVYQANAINIQISTSKIAEDNVELFVEYLKQNPLTLVIKRDKPTYEPLEINPELTCYNDITHISNNSSIPCNMKIKNSGYNAIIKPSTLYTVALDTNKSGTIGMNLGGVKGTTTNNVLKLTTPATLTDDSLRLYGKGIKGSKVRLLEGDKTNWIPSHFEGMKSSFEDKFDTTYNTYKMEILSKNRNLLEVEKLIDADNYIKGTYSSIKIPLKPNTRYYYNFDFQPNNIHRWVGVFSEPKSFKGSITKTLVWNEAKDGIKSGYIQTDNSTEYYLSVYQPNVNYHTNDWYKELFTTVCKNFVISEVESEYIDGLSNKIQFSSIEPLRGVGNIKDRFVFKDGKLMIERNIKNIVFDGSQSGYYYASWYTNDSLIRVGIRTNTSTVPKNKYNVAPISPQYLGYKWYTAIKCESIHIGGSDDIHFVLDSNRFKTKDLNGAKEFLSKNPIDVCYVLDKPYYEEIPFELQKLILEGYENGTLFFDTNIPPTLTVTYAGETSIVKATKLNKTEVLNNTTDINDNIIPYLMDMDYRVVCLELATETQGISMARLFGGTFEMLQRDILSKRYSVEEYKYRLDAYLSVNKITEKEYEELGEMLNE